MNLSQVAMSSHGPGSFCNVQDWRRLTMTRTNEMMRNWVAMDVQRQKDTEKKNEERRLRAAAIRATGGERKKKKRIMWWHPAWYPGI